MRLGPIVRMAQAVDERVLEQARKAAQAMGKSLDQAVRDYLEQLAGQAQRDAVIEELRSLALEGRSPEPGWRFDRDEIYAPRAERRRRLQLFATLEVVQIDVEMILGAPVDARAPPRGPGAGCPPVTPRQIFLRAGHFSEVTAGQGPPRLIC